MRHVEQADHRQGVQGGEAEDQREEVADEKGVSSIALTGASTFVKIDQGEKDTRLTSEQYIEQCKADFGLLQM